MLRALAFWKCCSFSNIKNGNRDLHFFVQSLLNGSKKSVLKVLNEPTPGWPISKTKGWIAVSEISQARSKSATVAPRRLELFSMQPNGDYELNWNENGGTNAAFRRKRTKRDRTPNIVCAQKSIRKLLNERLIRSKVLNEV